jgi:predicted CopG family antitoxin
MAVKTITIDVDAYALLAAEKKPDESFSKVIKRRLRPAKTARGLLEALPRCVLSEETLDLTENLVRSRQEAASESPILDLDA